MKIYLLILLLLLVVIGLSCVKLRRNKKMSKKELIACLKSMNCTLPDFEIVKQTYDSNQGWGSNGCSTVDRTIHIRFKRIDASKTIEKKISLRKDLSAATPASLTIEINVNNDDNSAIVKYHKSEDN